MTVSIRYVIGALMALAVTFAYMTAAQAAGYLKIGDIKGESTDAAADKDHKQWSDILSYSWGETSASGTSGAGGAGKVSMAKQRAQTRDAASGMPTGKRQHKPLTITKSIDKASPKLQEASTSGKVIPSMEIDLPRQDGRVGYLRYKLTNVMVSSYSTSGTSSGGDIPMEEITLNYEEVETTYVPQKAHGKSAAPTRAIKSDDSSKRKGNVEYEWKVEEGE